MNTVSVTVSVGLIDTNFIFHMLKTYPDYRIVCLDKLAYAATFPCWCG